MLKEYLTNIADAIRSKLGITDKVNAQDFADKVTEVYDKGKVNELNLFMRLDVDSRNKTYRVPNGVTRLRAYSFYNCWELRHIILPDSLTTLTNSVFANAYHLEDIRLPPNLTPLSPSGTFSGCTALKKITLANGSNFGFEDTWGTYNCSALTDIVIESGELALNWLLPNSPISVESMKHMIKHLKNYAGTDKAETYTIRFTNDCWSALEADSTPADEGIEYAGTWQEYVVSLGWKI